FRVTRERVRQIEAKAVRKLRHPVRARQLASFLDGVTLADDSAGVPIAPGGSRSYGARAILPRFADGHRRAGARRRNGEELLWHRTNAIRRARSGRPPNRPPTSRRRGSSPAAARGPDGAACARPWLRSAARARA